MEFRQSKKFGKELKSFLKKYRSLDKDLELLKSVLQAYPEGQGERHWNRLHTSDDQLISVFKVRLSCRSMKGESRFRVIYAYNQSTEQFVFIDFIEIYFKGDKANNDQSLIGAYLSEDLEGIF
jgi:hypothetical protein